MKKQGTLRVSPIRDQISHHMQGSMAMPADETVEVGRDGGWGVHTCQGLSQSNAIGITPHHAPIAPTTGCRRARSVSARGLLGYESALGGEVGIDLLEFGEDVNLKVTSVLEHHDGERPKNIGGGEVREKG